jgi:transposase
VGAIKYLLPGEKSDPGRTAADNRRFVDAIVYVLKTGIPWTQSSACAPKRGLQRRAVIAHRLDQSLSERSR